MKKRRYISTVVAIVVLLALAGVAAAFGVGNVDGVWSFIDVGGTDPNATCDSWATVSGSSVAWSATNPNVQTGSTTDENQVRYGVPQYYEACPTNSTGFLRQSGFGFNGVDGATGVTLDEPFYLGSFTHYNNPIYSSTDRFEWVDLTLIIPIDCDDDGDADTTFSFVPRFYLDETTNSLDPCPYLPGDDVNSNGCADAVDVEQPATTTFTCGTTEYTVNIYGFTSNDNCSTNFDQNAVSTQYVTKEQATNSACLWAEIDAPAADAGVAKTCNGFNGQDPHYVVTVTNYGPGTALGATIVDTLPSGVTYASYTSKRTVNNVETNQGTCTAAGQVVTCNLNAALPETSSDPTAKWVVDFNVDYAANANPLWENTVTLSTTSADDNLTNNTASATCTMPTAVELLSFTATPDRPGGIITLAWTTASEVDNLGFKLYRAIEPDGERTLINTELIPAQAPGSSGGAAYTYIDPIVGRDRNAAYYYWLESVDVNYGVALSGPIEASLTGKLQIQEPPTR